ncbi:MAG: hypothetical protein IJF78_11300 [Clostridia bacterium]|nr:hypothetical protein [Clostridia bacterium]
MKRFLNRLAGFLPHVCLILSLMMITFVITDRYNRAMAFINNDITKALLFVLAILVIIESVLLIRINRKRQWDEYRNDSDSDKN